MSYLILSAIGGILTGLSFNSPYFSFLVWFSLVPFIGIISKKRLYEGVIGSAAFGFFYYLTAIFWLTNVTKLGLIFLLLYLSFYCVLFFLAGRYFLKKPLLLISIPCLWVVLEFLKEIVFGGFGWANLGYSQYRNLYLIQTSDLFGAKFISFLIVMVNVLIWEIFSKKKLLLRKTILISLTLLICLLYSCYRLNGFKKSDSLEVSIIQPNIPQELKWDASLEADIIDRLTILARATKEDTLVIFPEASWPKTLERGNLKEIKSFVSGTERDILIGSVVREERKFYNTALFFDKKANLIDSYRKIKLVPFGEYIPLRKLLSFISVINSIGDMAAGEDITIFSHKEKKFSVIICFEDVFPMHVRNFARKSDFLINITNDAWFMGEPEASQHLSVMAFRAIENRISIVRSANTGISGWVSPLGKIEKLKRGKQEVFFPGQNTFNISLNKKRSFYNKYPEVFVIFCAIFLLGAFIKRSKSNPSDKVM